MRKSNTTSKKSATKKTPVKKAAPKKATAARKTVAKNATRKSAAKKAAPKKAVAKKAAPKKAIAKKAVRKTTTPSRSAMPAKKSAPRRSAMPAQKTDDRSMLADFFHDELKDIYWAEKHLVKTLPKMQKAATSQELKDAFGEHLEVTKTHVERLEQVFELLGHKAQAKKCDAMAGITEEGQGIIEETDKGTATRDVGLILSAQKVEHYEIATYGGLTQLAKTLGYAEIKEILGSTLAEEKEADETLSQIAEASINIEASQEDEDGNSNEEKDMEDDTDADGEEA